VTASSSGWTPHQSPECAFTGIAGGAGAGIGNEEVKKIVREHTEGRDLGVFGEPRINVLKLNLALDRKM